MSIYYKTFKRSKRSLLIDIGKATMQYQACFRTLPSDISEGKDRICYNPNKNGEAISNNLEDKWIELCKKHKILPDNVNTQLKESDNSARTYVLDLRTSKAMLYIYLCNLRFLEESQLLVKTAVDMFEEGYNFFVALAFAESMSTNRNHGYLYCDFFSQEYQSWQENAVSLTAVYGFAKLVSDPAKYDTRDKFGAKDSIYSAAPEFMARTPLYKEVAKTQLIKDIMIEQDGGKLEKLVKTYKNTQNPI